MYWDHSGKKLWLYSSKICTYNDFFFQSSCVMIREINNLNFRQLRYSSCMKTNSLDIKNNVG